MSRFPIDRRNFLKLAVAGAIMHKVHDSAAQPATTTTEQNGSMVAPAGEDTLTLLQTGVTRQWLGPNLWGNRLQDWQLADGRVECISEVKGPDLRTVSILTRELVEGDSACSLKVTLGTISSKGKGFGGFLIGAGAGKLDYRAAALVQKGSGENGGMLCVVDTEGVTSFREHTDEDNWMQYAELPSRLEKGAPRSAGGTLLLSLDITPTQGTDTFSLKLTASESGKVISTSILDEVPGAEVLGGVMLASAATSGPDGSRFWFRDILASGEKLKHVPARALGPVMGTLFSLNESVMKMTAQLMPVGAGDPQDVELSIREQGTGDWRILEKKPLGPGFSAGFRIEGWDSQKDWDYRISYAEDGTGRSRPAHYEGTISKDPVHLGSNMSIGLYSCTIATARSLDGGGGRRTLPGAQDLGRYTPQSMYFPYKEIVTSTQHHKPDMLVFAGDQFYENNPTEKDRAEAPVLDYLYKYYLWMWSFRELTRDRPALVLVDDHDVYHGNLWGNGGRPAPEDNQDLGGYVRAADWVKMVQRTQCGHNPDPWDPTPVQQGIGVYYCAFKYGGADFCLLEDRKWKTAPMQGESMNVHVAELLGARQEKFLEEWGAKTKDAEARICLTATLLACAQTGPDGEPLVDFDSNGYPPLARHRAVRLLRKANVLILAGDQHLASVIRLGDENHTDGPIQFSGPAGATSWTRWFEPKLPLANSSEFQHTGDFQDGFGNRMRVLAVANPPITFKEYRKHVKGRGQGIGDRNLKAEGYGIVRVDRTRREYTLECWRWDMDPTTPAAKQFAGWPLKFRFDEVGQG